MDLGLKNKVAVVLASSKGLGLACAKGFYAEGAHVVICSRNESNLKRAEEEIKSMDKEQLGNEVMSLVADLSRGENIRHLIEKAMNRFGRIDILVHNAGGPPSKPVEDVSEEEWTHSINLNLRSFIRACDLVIPIMREQGQGKIIAITSVSVKQPLEDLVLSNTLRLGVVGFAKTLSNEEAKYGISVNVVCPGPTLTDRMNELIQSKVQATGKPRKEIEKSWTDQIPLGRLGRPEELANVVVFLGSERASYITGTVIQVDGGFVKGTF
ncbi:MAG: SDR family oxidoreductase [Promethearchaeota archaeon]